LLKLKSKEDSRTNKFNPIKFHLLRISLYLCVRIVCTITEIAIHTTLIM